METSLRKQSRLEKLDRDSLSNIVSRLSYRDLIRMTCVSKSYCKALLSITRPQLPWLMIVANANLESSEEEENARQFFSLLDNTIYSIRIPQIRHKHCCGCFMNADGWLMTVDKHTVIRLVYPWGRRIIEEKLPASDVLRRPEASMRSYSLFESTLVKKAAMSDNRAFLVVLNDLGKAFFLRRGDDVWTEPSIGNELHTIMGNRFLDDVIYHMGHFYVVNSIGGVGVLRTNDAKLQRLRTMITGAAQNKIIRNYLVGDSTSGRLYLVQRTGDPIDNLSGYETKGFKVYEIKKDENRIDETLMVVQSLEDGVIFLGLNSSLLVMGSEFTGNIRRNCIYFTDDTSLRHSYFRKKTLRTPDMGIFNMENKRIDRLLEERTSHPHFSMPLWITPPPAVRRQ